MRRVKPLPTESSFKEFAENRPAKRKSTRKKGTGHQRLENKFRDKKDSGKKNQGVRKSENRRGRDSTVNRQRGRRELFDAICMKCGNRCKVPFKPTTGKGVSCSNCFDKNKKPSRDKRNVRRSRY